VVNVADCYRRRAGSNQRAMHGFFSHVKEVEDIGLKNKHCKRSKTCLIILKELLVVVLFLLLLMLDHTFATSDGFIGL
jgi:hypothetical protein